MQIIEFCGIPGSGKTSLCTDVVQKLTEKGHGIFTREDVYFFGSKNTYFNLLKAFLHPGNLKIYFNIFIINRKYSKDFKSIKYALQLIIYYYQLKRISKNSSHNFAILDEGVIQYLSALSSGAEIEDFKKIKCIIGSFESIFDHWLVIKCEIDPETAVCRIKNRSTNSRRFSKDEDNTSLLEKLSNRYVNLNYLLKLKNNVTIDMTQDIKTNSEIIMNLISCRMK